GAGQDFVRGVDLLEAGGEAGGFANSGERDWHRRVRMAAAYEAGGDLYVVHQLQEVRPAGEQRVVDIAAKHARERAHVSVLEITFDQIGVIFGDGAIVHPRFTQAAEVERIHFVSFTEERDDLRPVLLVCVALKAEPKDCAPGGRAAIVVDVKHWHL